EDPKLAKGLVRREVVETVTPGTVLAEDWLERDRNNFLVALDPRSGGAAPGLAALDLTTGELALETVPVEDLASALARYESPEVVLPAGCKVVPAYGSVTVTEREAWEFDPELAREDLARTFRLDAVDVLVHDPRGRDRLREALDGVRDLERLAGRAALGRATPRELGALRDSIFRLPDVRSALDGLEARGAAAPLERAAERFDLLADLGDELGRALVERPPAQLADGDAIRAGYDRELDELKDARDGGK